MAAATAAAAPTTTGDNNAPSTSGGAGGGPAPHQYHHHQQQQQQQQPPPHLRHYYVAVGSGDAKAQTLVELLLALRGGGGGGGGGHGGGHGSGGGGKTARLAVAVACGARDSLDEVVAALAAAGCFSLAVLHADLSPADVEQQVARLKRALQQHQGPAAHDGSGAQQQQQQQQQQQHHHPHPPGGTEDAAAAAAAVVVVASDAALRALPRGLTPLGPPLLFEFDLPPSKDVLTRRLAAVFGSSKERRGRVRAAAVVDFVAAGEVAAFRARERLTGAPIAELPVHAADILLL